MMTSPVSEEPISENSYYNFNSEEVLPALHFFSGEKQTPFRPNDRTLKLESSYS